MVWGNWVMSKQGFQKILDLTVNPAVSAVEAPHPEGGIVFVRMAREDEIETLHQLTVSQIGRQVAPLEAMQDVYRHNPESLWIIFRSPSGDKSQAQLAGYYGFLHLNEAGHKALDARTLTPRNPDLSLLTVGGERPHAVYIWAIVARKLTTLTIPLVGKGLGIKRYGGLPFYATAATMGGLNGLKGYGFTGAGEEPVDELGGLFQFYMPGEADRASPSAA
jgi:hypothetical protein